MAADLRALGSPEALWIMDQCSERVRTVAYLMEHCPGCASALMWMGHAGLVKSRELDPDTFVGLTSRGREAWMALRGWQR